MYTTEIGMLLTYLALCIIIGLALKRQMLIRSAPYLAVTIGLSSNYISAGLANSSIVEIAVRIVVAYVVIRVSAGLTAQLTATLPVHMHYSTQQPAIDFEEVQPHE